MNGLIIASIVFQVLLALYMIPFLVLAQLGKAPCSLFVFVTLFVYPIVAILCIAFTSAGA